MLAALLVVTGTDVAQASVLRESLIPEGRKPYSVFEQVHTYFQDCACVKRQVANAGFS